LRAGEIRSIDCIRKAADPVVENIVSSMWSRIDALESGTYQPERPLPKLFDFRRRVMKQRLLANSAAANSQISASSNSSESSGDVNTFMSVDINIF
jgi:hypothetical protein